MMAPTQRLALEVTLSMMVESAFNVAATLAIGDDEPTAEALGRVTDQAEEALTQAVETLANLKRESLGPFQN